MSTFKSMLYREYKVNKTGFLLAFAMMLGFCLMIWTMIFITGQDDSNMEGLEAINAMPQYALAMIAAIFGVVGDSTMNSDIESGFMSYSYTLPIKPSDRALSRIAFHAVCTLVGSVVYLVNQALVCRYSDKEFSLHYLTILVLCIAGSMLMKLLMNLFTLSARTKEELKAATPKTAVVSIGAMGILIVVLKLTVASDSAAFLEKITNFRLTDRVALMGLLIGIGAIALLTVAFYFLDSRLLGNPYGGLSAGSKAKTDKRDAVRASSKSAEKLNIKDNDDHFNGFLYKTLRQNKLLIIFVAAMPFIGIIVSFIFSILIALNDGDNMQLAAANASAVYARAAITGICTFIMTMLLEQVFTDGGKKLNSYFIAALPGGIKKNLYYKYVVMLMVDAIFFASLNIADSILATVSYQVTGKTPMSLSSIFFAVFFLILFINSINTPVIMRFGEKTGTLVRLIGLIGITIAVAVIFCFMSEGTRDTLMKFFVDIFRKISKGEIPGGIMLALSIAPIAVTVMYMISYKISAKFYMKGVQSYDK